MQGEKIAGRQRKFKKERKGRMWTLGNNREDEEGSWEGEGRRTDDRNERTQVGG